MALCNFLGQGAAAIKREKHANFINRLIPYKIEIANIDDRGELPGYNKELNQAKTLGWLNDIVEWRGKWKIYKKREKENNRVAASWGESQDNGW